MSENIIFQGIDNLKVTDDKVIDTNNSGIYCLGICLNSGCNYNCIYCYAKENAPYNEEEQLKFEEYKKIINSAAKMGCKTVIITGVASPSEPLLSKMLMKIINIINSYKMYAVIYTNAYILGDTELCQNIHGCTSNELIKFFHDNKVSLMISCDSLNENDYNNIVQCNDAFKVFKKAMKNLINGGFYGEESKIENIIISRVAISCVINKKNIHYLEKMRDYVHSNNWQFICKFPSLVGNAVKYKDYFFSPEEVKKLRPLSSDKYTDKKETLVIESVDKNKFCLANQLGIAINGKGQPLTCLSGNIFLDSKVTVRDYKLSELVIKKKNIFGLKPGDCPKKKKYYKE